MNRIRQRVTTALAFIAGEVLVFLMLLAALVYKLLGRIGRSRPPH
jgi:hypothetical protein